MTVVGLRLMRNVACLTALILAGLPGGALSAAHAETSTPAQSSGDTKTPAAAAPSAPSQTPPAPATSATPTTQGAAPAHDDTRPAAEAPVGKPGPTEIEPNGSPGIPDNATTESVTVPKRPILMVTGASSYDDAFKSVKASIEKVAAAMTKAGIKPSGHPITLLWFVTDLVA